MIHSGPCCFNLALVVGSVDRSRSIVDSQCINASLNSSGEFQSIFFFFNFRLALMIGAKIRFFKVNIYSSADLVTCCDVSDKALATRVVIGVYSTWVT